ncbi:MAG: aldo/keto reductase [Tissierellia bacterium]|nr:aldo/keto reductase [Tissierellia bacterium]
MQYRDFTKDAVKTSLLGFGCMRFPCIDNDNSKINYTLSAKLLQYAIDKGINYIDTAYNYHQENSEKFVGQFLEENNLRKDIYLATKNPVWKAENHEDFERLLDEQLDRLKSDYIDFYLLHALDKKRWDKIKSLDVFKFVEKAKSEKKIKYIGFSFHDKYEYFEEILNAYDWDFCQIQLNFMDENYQAGLKGLKLAAKKGISVVIMEPLKGGKLAKLPDDILSVFKNINPEYSSAENAMRYLMNMPEVSVVLSGMNDFYQIDENIKTACETLPNSLTEAELNSFKEVEGLMNQRTKVDCTACEYCMPCPFNVNIPGIFRLYNNKYIYGDLDSEKNYENLVKSEKDQSQCVECGHCETQCPQHLEIIEDLKAAHNDLYGRKI